jgi:uncharacterized protein (TIGR00375 family)
MRFIGDLHIHSSFSRATSRAMVPEGIWKWAQYKGITVVGSGDFTHPKWFQELTTKLEPADNGLHRLKKEYQTTDIYDACRREVYFLLSVEISCIYKKNGKTRKIHCLVFVPDFQSAARFSAMLGRLGNISSDGRPILGLDAKHLLEIVLETAPEALFIPAHAWTPHFSVFGAASGFDSLEECFEDLSPAIPALETGLSSDPLMNRRLSALDRLTLISNSDAHSPQKLGREANIFDTALSYEGIATAIRTRQGFLGTIEFFPEEGKYHYDGHRNCSICFSPRETIASTYVCPVCNKRLTVGVMHRVEVLADRREGIQPSDAPGYCSAVPLMEILAEVYRKGVASKSVQEAYMRLLSTLGCELEILLDRDIRDIQRSCSPLVAEAIDRMRSGQVCISPGYDGEYGKVCIFKDDADRECWKGQEGYSGTEGLRGVERGAKAGGFSTG